MGMANEKDFGPTTTHNPPPNELLYGFTDKSVTDLVLFGLLRQVGEEEREREQQELH